MNSKQLQYFLTVVTTGSIASAARELDIAQPAVSQQLANLERELGAMLLQRSYKGVSLTPEGEVFFAHAGKLVNAINAAKSDVRQLSSHYAGTVRVGVLPSIGNVLSMPLVEMVSHKYPQMELEISTGPSYSVKGWLESRQIDIAITYATEVTGPRYRTYPLINEALHCVFGCTDTQPVYQRWKHKKEVRFWELSDVELLIPGKKDALGQLIAAYEQSTGVALKHSKAYSGQLMTALRQVVQGDGAMILPSSATFHLEEGGLVKALKITDPPMMRLVTAATNSSGVMAEATAKMLEIIKMAVAGEQAAGHWRGDLAFTHSPQRIRVTPVLPA